MRFEPYNLYHVYNEGNNKQRIFYTSEDYLTFLTLFRKMLAVECETICYCLSPDRFDFLLYTDDRINTLIKQGSLLLNPVSNGFRKLLSQYAKNFNRKMNASGSLFRQKTRAEFVSQKPLPSNSLYTLDNSTGWFHYIHDLPYKLRLVSDPLDWPYSSLRDYAALRNDSLCNKQLGEILCSYTSQSLHSPFGQWRASNENFLTPLMFRHNG